MNLNPIVKINEKDIKKVVQLDNRPNVSGGYGQAKLSAEQLKAWFDAYPAIVRQKVDDIISILSSGERSGDYIALRLEREDKDGSKITLGLSLYDLIESFANGSWADYFTVQTAQATESESLIACLNGILKTIGNSDTSDETVLGRLAHLEEENKSQASEIAENAKGIASNKAYAEKNTERIVKNETDIANTAKDITQIKRRLQFVEGATLSVESNSEVAFEKITPTNAGTYATIEKIGCITVRNSNLCIADGYYELKDELDFVIKLGVLEAGEYTFYFEGDFTGAAGISCLGETSTIDPRTDITSNTEFTLSVPEREGVSLYLYSVASDSDPQEPDWDTYPRLNGTITGIMLCNASDADKSYHPYLKSDNLCKADGRYDLTSRTHDADGQNITLDLGRLEEGIYQLTWYGEAMSVACIEANGNVVRDYDITYNDHIFGMTEANAVSASLISVCGFDNMYDRPEDFPDWEEYCWSGVITGIMLVKLSDTCNGIEDVRATSPILDLKYEEKSGALWKAKPTGIESRGANLLNMACPESVPSDTTDGTDKKRIFEPNTLIVGLSRNNYYRPHSVSLEGRTANSFTFTATNYGYTISFALKLKPNTQYFVSYESDKAPTPSYAFYADDGTWLSANIPNGTNKAFGFTTDNYGNVVIGFTMTAGESVTISNLMITRGTEAVPYKEYVGTIDTKALPEAVQSLEGWGLGIDAEYNNHFEVRDGRVFYVQMVEKTVIDGTVNKITYVGKSNDLYYGMLDVASATKPTINILNSHFKGERVTSLGNAYLAGAEAKSLIMFNTNQNLTTVALWNDWLKEEDSKGNPVTSVYALATPIETDITHLFPNFSGYIDITTEAGGSVFAINKYSLPVPWTITYITKA